MALSKGFANAFKFASLAALEVKLEGIIGSVIGLSEHLGHIDIVPAEADDFDVLHAPVASVYPPPAHIHTGVLADVLACNGRILRLVDLYDSRLERRYRKTGLVVATETEQRRVRCLLKAVYATAALEMLHEACKAHRADVAARRNVSSMQEVA